MALFPKSFVDDVRLQADIVAVVQETVPLRRVGATYKGLCPFHPEKTPSFHVNREKGFFHCFGCGVGGDVFKFVELRDRTGFAESVRHLAERFGIPVPEARDRDAGADAEREGLLKVHEVAAAWFREQLSGPGGSRPRAVLERRGLTRGTIETLGLGFAPPTRDALRARLAREGFSLPLVVKSGLAIERDGGGAVDRFRNRLMIPICRESGPVVAFGGRAMEADQVPKYLNSPETPIYSKGRTLYGLHLSKTAVRKEGRAVLVEGYFDFAQVWQGGLQPVVATCGTALTPTQAQLLRRFASRVVLSFDPDPAGQGAAARSSDLLVTEGFEVKVALLPAGEDPDAFVRAHGGQAYQEAVDGARPYLDYLLDRAAAGRDLADPDARLAFVNAMLGVAARIPDAAARDQFADRVAHRARISEDVIRAEIRKAAVTRRTALPAVAQRATGAAPLKDAERHLLTGLLTRPDEAFRALGALDEGDLQGLASARILRAAVALADESGEIVPSALLERLSDQDARLLTGLGVSAPAAAAASLADCARTLRLLRYERERAEVQREIDQLQELGDAAGRLDGLLVRKGELSSRIEALNA